MAKPKSSIMRNGLEFSLHAVYVGLGSLRAAKILAKNLRGDGYRCVVQKRKYTDSVYSNALDFKGAL